MAVPPGRRRAGDGRPLRRSVVAGLLLVTACRAAPDPTGAAGVTMVLPGVVAAPIPLPELSPGAVESAIVASGDGGWLYAPADLRSSALVAVDADGRTARSLGGFGEGPGEMHASFPLWLDDTVAIGHDLATRRVIVWNRDGTIRREFRPSEPVIPIGRGPAATLLARRSIGRSIVPAVVDLATGKVRDLLLPEDSLLAGVVGDHDGLSERIGNLPAVGRWRDGVAVGNGATYSIGLWHGDGTPAAVVHRDLPPAHMGPETIEREIRNLGRSALASRPGQMERLRDELQATPVSRFDQVGAPRSDGRGRLWVVVKEADSVVADVFADARFLGRIPLECPGFAGRWDLAGAWLLLMCEPRDPSSDLDAEVRRYRIVEPGG